MLVENNSGRGLFTGFDIREVMGKEPIRPLGPLSDFVVEQMPSYLADIQAGGSVNPLVQHAQELVNGVDMTQFHLLLQGKLVPSSKGKQMVHPADLAGFDLKMLRTAIVASKGEVPEKLIELSDKAAEATVQPKGITYEELMWVNPDKDMRLFTTGAVGASEADFYRGHVRIEDILYRVVGNLRDAKGKLLFEGRASVHHAAMHIEAARKDFGQAVESLRAFRRVLPLEHFTTMRPYFSPIAEGLRGPSGLFSPGFPQIDLLLGGEDAISDQKSFTQANRLYFPRMGRMEIAEDVRQAEAGNSLEGISYKLGQPLPLEGARIGMSLAVSVFRKEHIGAAMRNIPELAKEELKRRKGEEVDDPAKGTGDEAAMPLMKRRIGYRGGDHDLYEQ